MQDMRDKINPSVIDQLNGLSSVIEELSVTVKGFNAHRQHLEGDLRSMLAM